MDWCARPSPSAPCSHDESSFALTTLFTRASTGEILDADVELNAVAFSWGDLTLGALSTEASPSVSANDLQNALTHELGHGIGLDHPCTIDGADGALDDHGAPVPACAAASPAITETTMFPTSSPGDLSKRTLAADDEAAAREIYPAITAGTSAGECGLVPTFSPDEQGGCAVLPSAPKPEGLAVFALAGVFYAWARRRERTGAR